MCRSQQARVTETAAAKPRRPRQLGELGGVDGAGDRAEQRPPAVCGTGACHVQLMIDTGEPLTWKTWKSQGTAKWPRKRYMTNYSVVCKIHNVVKRLPVVKLFLFLPGPALCFLHFCFSHVLPIFGQ